ncbi:hypothetical protein A0H76_1316 [Hepatospora eriocheir]|uniref:Uncharacterized protein n=1 Tax=Hepatospora eriocheir TaxID=1081669 RepID=A0A1X0QHC8_9MICR|nr:hypothetical protein A0H76_1316 [Hepatospora eriocheir]
MNKESPLCMDIDNLESLVVSGYRDGNIKLFNFDNNRLNLFQDIPKNSNMNEISNPITGVAVINRKLFVTADFSGNVMIYTGTGQFTCINQKRILEGPIYDMSYFVEKEQVKLYLGCDKGYLYIVTFNENNLQDINVTGGKVHNFGLTSVSVNKLLCVTCGIDSKVKFTLNNTLSFKNDDVSDLFKDLEFGSEPATTVCVTKDNNFNRNFIAIGYSSGQLVILEYHQSGEYTSEIFQLGSPIKSLKWGKSGFGLTVCYGNNEYKAFAITEESKFEEISFK